MFNVEKNFRSTQTCTQTYTYTGILESSECSERHGFQPLSHGHSGAVTYILQKLQLLSESPDVRHEHQVQINRRTSLLFENKPEIVKEQIQVEDILDLLENLRQKTTNGTEDDTPRLFSHLVYYVRNVNYDKLAIIFDMIKKSSAKQLSNLTQFRKMAIINVGFFRKIFLDAISLVSTPDGIKIMRKLYEESEITEYQINSWITSLAFTKNPSIEVLNEMKVKGCFIFRYKTRMFLIV